MTTKFNSNPRRQSTSGFNATRQLKLSPQCPHSNATPVSRSGSQEEKIERESWNCPGDHQSAIGGPYYQFDRLLSPANQLHKRTLAERPASGQQRTLVATCFSTKPYGHTTIISSQQQWQSSRTILSLYLTFVA